jgi:hypothetical protein
MKQTLYEHENRNTYEARGGERGFSFLHLFLKNECGVLEPIGKCKISPSL